MERHLNRFAVMLLLLMASLNAYAGAGITIGEKPFDPDQDIPVEALLSHTAYTPGMKGEAVILFHVPENYHITDIENGLFYVEYDTIEAVQITDIRFPQWIVDEEGNHVYRGTVPVIVKFTLSKELDAPFTYTLRAGYQVCSEIGTLTCYMPIEKNITLDLKITNDKSEVSPISTEWFTTSEPSGEGSLENRISSALASGSLIWVFLLVFLGGILSSFTPCVYPMIPVTIAYIGARSGKSRFSGFYLSLFFVLGMALTYSILGVIAAASGSSFGSFGQSATVQFVIAGIFLILALSMFGLYEIQMPSGLMNKMQSGAKAGPMGAIVMGSITGFIGAPCVGPVIGVLLVYIAGTGDLLFGFTLMMTYAVGMGMLFLVIGTFSGALNSLPSAGGWMETIRNAFGVVMVAMAIYFVRLYIPESTLWMASGAFMVMVGVYTGAFARIEGEGEFGEKLMKSIGIIVLVAGLYFLIGGVAKAWPVSFLSTAAPVTATAGGAQSSGREVEWLINAEEEGFALAAAESKPIMIDFYADWCAACKELDENTYNQPEVVSLSQRFVNIKMDFTRANTGSWEKQMREKYRIVGMPTVILLKSDGTEITRFMGFKKAKDLLPLLEHALQMNG